MYSLALSDCSTIEILRNTYSKYEKHVSFSSQFSLLLNQNNR